ncbi:hypothetical protein KLP28_13160 [Nocardioidaceae bacterium]|nr:hypothetical protein KLP28_13160 [Nocardioidaceae bacterium]
MDLSALRPVFEHAGPFTTVHVDVSRDVEDADHRIDIRRRDVESDLREAGVDDTLVEEIGRRIAEQSGLQGSVRRTLVATDGQVVLDTVHAGVEDSGRTVDHGPLPHLLPWVTVEDRAVSFVLAVADRTGAEVSAYRAAAGDPESSTTVEGGETYYISKVDGVGGEAENRVERLAEENWKANAREIAEEVVSQSRSLGGRPLLLLAGEVQMLTELVAAVEHVDAGAAERVRQLESGSRADGASEEAMWSEVHEVLQRAAVERDGGLGNDLDMARGRDEGSREGADDVLTALTKAQVETVLVEPGLLEDATVDPSAFTGLPLPMGAVEAGELPLGRVLLAAACLSGADMSVVPRGFAGPIGVAALLRWAENPPVSEAGRDQNPV